MFRRMALEQPRSLDFPPVPILKPEDALNGNRVSKPSPSGLAATFRSLRHRNYRLYFSGQVVSLIGSWMQTTALMWVVFERTNQSKWPALITAGQILPTFLLGGWAGALADRVPKRSLLLVTQTLLLLLALVLAGTVVMGFDGPWQLLAITVATGLVQALDLPARLAFVMDMVGRKDLMNAVALNSVLFNMARAVGPAIGGWLLVVAGAWPCFLANGLSYLALLWGLLQMDAPGLPTVAVRGRKLTSVFSGCRYLMERPPLLFLVLLATILSLCAWPFMALLPAMADHILGARAHGYSVMLSGTGCGALGGALTVATFGSLQQYRRLVAAGVAVIIVGLIGLSLVTSLTLATACCGLVGFGLILFFATSQAVVQLGAGDHNRGLIMGVWAMLLSGAVPLGNLLAGPAADCWGVAWVLRGEGIACAGGVLVLLTLLMYSAPVCPFHERHRS